MRQETCRRFICVSHRSYAFAILAEERADRTLRLFSIEFSKKVQVNRVMDEEKEVFDHKVYIYTQLNSAWAWKSGWFVLD